MALEFFDSLFRFGAIVTLAWIVILAYRADGKAFNPSITLTMAFSTACYLIAWAYDEQLVFGLYFGTVISISGRMMLVMSWLFGITLFKDNFRFSLLYQVVVGAYFIRAVMFEGDIVTADTYAVISYAMHGGILVYLLYVILKEAPGDLLENRRSFRIWFVAIVIVSRLAATFEKVIINPSTYQDGRSLIESMTFFLVYSAVLFYMMRPEKKHLFETRGLLGDTESQATNQNAAQQAQIAAADQLSLELLQQKMRDGLYREPGMNIAKLAALIAIPEYRLRKLINVHLGHRNISNFLNHYRIAEAQKQLANIAERHTPILTIAMDVGYTSLRPFNIAFKNRTGLTPSAYREKELHTQSQQMPHNDKN